MRLREYEIDLCGTWKFIPDRFDTGGEEGYMAPACDTSLWREAEIPCTFEEAAQEMTGYRGAFWFRRTFTADPSADGLLWLEFAAVNYRADVWINGIQVGTHTGGYLPFRFEVSRFVKPGENLLCVRVDNQLVCGMLPPAHFWRGHGGIIRRTGLYRTPECYIDSVRIEKTGDRIRFTTRAVNASAEKRPFLIRHECAGRSAQDTITVPAGAEGTSEIEIPSDGFELWSPEDPVLYRCDTTLRADFTEDAVSVSFGVRDLAAADGKILLNGKEIFLRGFNRHEDSPEKKIATDAGSSERDFRIMKETGANFVRFCHYPHSEEELDLCDRLGLVVLAEIPLNALMDEVREYDAKETSLALPETYHNAREALREMIERDFNHPSIVFWSVSNETNEGVPQVRLINRSLVQLAKQLDPSRFAVHVSKGGWWDNPDIPDPLFGEDDVICVNSYVTMEHTNAKSLGSCPVTEEDYRHAGSFWDSRLPLLREKYPGKPVVVTEFGFPSEKFADGIRDEEKQADVLRCDMVSMEGRVAGYAVWHFADHEWEITEEGRVFFGGLISPYGVYTRDRKPKKSADFLASFWKDASAD